MADTKNTPPVSSAFANVGAMIGPNIYDNKNAAYDPYLQFISSSADATAKGLAFQNIYRGLATQAAPAGSNQGNMFDYLQTLLRSTGASKGTTAIGIIDPKDISALETVLGAAIGQNADVIPYLQSIAASGGFKGAGTVIKQPDTTTKYNRQISVALQYKDATDAKNEFNSAHFAAFGSYPKVELIDSFQNAWNNEVNAQKATTTSAGVTKFTAVPDKTKPIIDPKTKKPKLDKDGKPMYQQLKNKEGILQYEAATTTTTKSTGLGFTQDEQQQFLAEYLVTNFPDQEFDVETLGGAAKAIYNDIIATHKNNFDETPTLDKVMPVIKSVIGNADANVAKAALDKYKEDIRTKTANKYMAIADYVKAGEDANKYIQPLIASASNFLESDVSINDPFIKKALNFKAQDGTYRLMNEYELSQELMNDPRYGKTSKAKNEAINLAQTLANKLGR